MWNQKRTRLFQRKDIKERSYGSNGETQRISATWASGVAQWRQLNSFNRLSRVNLPLESRFTLRFKGKQGTAGDGADENRETKTAVAPSSDWIHRGNVFNSIGLCRLRRRRRHRWTWSKDGEKSGVGFYQGGERTSVSAGNEAYHPASPRVSDLLSLSTFPPLLASSCPPRRPFLAVVVEDENRIYIPSLVRPGKYYERVYAPAATSYDKRARRRRKIDALVATLLSTCSTWPRFRYFCTRKFRAWQQQIDSVRSDTTPVCWSQERDRERERCDSSLRSGLKINSDFKIKSKIIKYPE